MALPKLDPIDLEEDLRTTFEQAFDENGLERDDVTRQALRQLTKLLADHISTPREIRRLGNAIRFALPILKGETNPIDVCRIEALRLLFPEEFEKVLRHSTLLTDRSVVQMILARQYRASTGSALGFGDPLGMEKPSELFRLFERAPKSALHLLAQTFPAVRLDFNVNLGAEERFQGEYPASDPAYIKRYLQYSIASDDVEDARVRDWVDVAGRGGDISAHLTAMQTSKRLDRFLEKIRQYGEPLDEDGRFHLIVQLLRHTYQHPESKVGALAFRGVAIDVLQRHAVLTPAVTRWNLLERVLKALPAWWMQANFFKAALSLYGPYQRAQEDITSSAPQWMAGVLRDHTAELFAHSWVDPVWALGLLAEHYGREYTQPMVLAYVQASPAQKTAWLLTLARQNQGAHGPVPSAFGLDQYLNLDRVVDLNVLLPEVAMDPPQGLLSRPEDATAWAMVHRLGELHADAQQILGRTRAAEEGPDTSIEAGAEG
ncbi:hypothetical protein ACFOLM_24500 [Deinococcus soli (ex Cha et al. 2016)]|uniref:hypothetical protein n=1 Tax=Deinococcus soli (ex Cha et al. 2016) TaxID=1309411 RepID=UPI00361655F5